ncbi:MAG: hypothetical protein RLZ04_2333 [Actinomycetota bacterium]|jgi:hypothetical protein
MTGTGPDDDEFISLRADILRRTDLGEFGERPWENWPTDYVRRELVRSTMLWNSRRPMGMTGLPPAAMTVPEALRVAWLVGRAEIDGLAPAGLHP